MHGPKAKTYSPCFNIDFADSAFHSLFPQLQVDVWECVAGDPGVEEGVGDIKHAPLHRLDLVAVRAGNLNINGKII